MDKYPLIRFVSFHSPLLLSLLAPSDLPATAERLSNSYKRKIVKKPYANGSYIKTKISDEFGV